MIEIESELDPLKNLALQDMSYSRISTFEWCELKYYFSYIMKFPQEYGPPAVLGNIIHKALEVTIEDGEEINAVELLQNYKAAIPEYDPDGNIPADMIQNGEDMLMDFVNTNTGEMSVYAKELPFSFALGRARVNGYIDFVDVPEEETKPIHIIDYKTGKRQISYKETPTNIQLGIYSMFMKYLFPDRDIYSELYYTKNGSTRGHQFTSEDIAAVEVALTEKVEEILNTENFLPTPNEYNCKFCSYADDGTCSAGFKRLKKFGLK